MKKRVEEMIELMDGSINKLLKMSGIDGLNMANMDDESVVAIKSIIDIYEVSKEFMLEYVESEERMRKEIHENNEMLKELIAMNKKMGS